ncbi:exported protein of unknown function [Magnetospirillum gryphiswaldense MSR-1 v2]|uniref:Phage tail collar domain-containing protein n=2 Tax=Magnetospirillum gryphiswaldense TaxID=55518 RepID=V6F4P4_MAGGM|nr:exported protein of unknown function [Magnetospirillum gryphiswaldense MSR-1 v2]
MTLQHTYGANGAATLFPFSFAVDAASDVEVLIDAIEQTSGFVVRGAGGNDGGSVLFDAAPALGAVVTLRHRGRVSVSALDTASGHLADKLVAGGGVSLSLAADADGRQTLTIAASAVDGALQAAQNLADLTDKAAARGNLEVYSTDDVDDAITASSDLALKKGANLGDVVDKVAARGNLDVYSTGEVNAVVTTSSNLALKKGANLGDVVDKAAARGNLEVYSTGEVYTRDQAATAFADKTLSTVDAALVRANLGLGDAALLNVGSSAGNVVVLDGSGLVPAALLPAAGPSGSSPTGSLIQFAGSAAPEGWLLCDGNAVSRSTYAALFAVVGTVYGVGDGATTFALPDLRGRAAIGAGQGTSLTNRTLGDKVGAETHVLSVAEMPSHSHNYESHRPSSGAGGPVLGSSDGVLVQTTNSVGSNAPHNNMPPSLALNFIIKT